MTQESWRPGGPTKDETTRSLLLVGHRHFLKLFYFLFYVDGCFLACIYVCLSCLYLMLKALDPLELQLETVTSCRVGSGNQMWALWKNGPYSG